MPAQAALVVGIGFTRGAPARLLARGIARVLADHGLSLSSVRALATIDRKRDEPGLTELAAAHAWPLVLYSAAELAEVTRDGEGSAHALSAVGTTAVAAPAARRCAGASALLVDKTTYREASGSLTVAVALAPEARDG